MKIELSLLMCLGLLGCVQKTPTEKLTARPLKDYRFEKTATRLERGRYLATIVECFACHSPIDSVLFLPIPGKEGSGDILDTLGPEVAPNITPDVETGAGNWTDDMFVRAIREGFGHDGRPLLATMPSEYYGILTIRTGRVGGVRELNPWMEWPYFRNMTDYDLAAIFRYLRAQPPVHHNVDNSEPPRKCKLCGRTHGLGELN